MEQRRQRRGTPIRCKLFRGRRRRIGVRESAASEEIANLFSLSEQTVKNHLYCMKRKVWGNGRLEIVDVCRQHGFPARLLYFDSKNWASLT